MSKPKIKEVIVVEGKDDVSALRRAVEADILITTGLGLTKDKITEIIWSMLKGHNGINQEFSNRNTIEKCSLKYLEIKQHVAK